MKKKERFSVALLLMCGLAGLEAVFACLPTGMFVWSQRLILLMIIVLAVALGVKEQFILNPYFCFVLTPFSLMVYDPSVSTRFLTALDSRVYIVAVYAFLAFLAGLHLATRGNRRNEAQFSLQESAITANQYARVGCALAAIWAAYQVLSEGLHISIPFSAMVTQIIYIALAFFFRSRKRYAIVLSVFVIIYLLLSNFRKTAFLYIFILFILTMLNNRKTSKKALILGVLGVGLGGLLMVFVAYPLKMYFSSNGSFSGMDSSVDGLTDIMLNSSKNYGSVNWSIYILRPYLSMTTEWTNLNYVLTTQTETTYGMFFLRPVLNLLQFNTSKLAVYELKPRSNYYNTFGFLTTQIKDFGDIGAVLLTFLEGIFSGYCYVSFRKRRNDMIAVVRYLFVSCAIIEMFFSNHFLLGGIHIVYLVTFLLRYVIKLTYPQMYRAMNKQELKA